MNKTIITTSNLVEKLETASHNVQSVAQDIQFNIDKALSTPNIPEDVRIALNKVSYDISGFKYEQLTEKPSYDVAIMGNIFYLQELEYQLINGSDIITEREYIKITESNVSEEQYDAMPLNSLYSATNILLDNNLASSVQTILNTIEDMKTYTVSVWDYDSINGNDLKNQYNDVNSAGILPKSPNPPNLEAGQIWISRNMSLNNFAAPEIISKNMACQIKNTNPFDVLCEMTGCCYDTEDYAKLALRNGQDTFNGVVKSGSLINTENYEYSGKYVACRFKYNGTWSGISCCQIK